MGIIKRALQLDGLLAQYTSNVMKMGFIYQPYVPLMVTHNIFIEDVKSRTFNLKLKK